MDKKCSFSLLKSWPDAYNRNEAFPFAIGLLLVFAGSGATILYFVSAVATIFLNPKLTAVDNTKLTFKALKSLPILTALYCFFICLILFSIFHENLNELPATLASHLQILFIVPLTLGILSISQSENALHLFIKGLTVGIYLILPVCLYQIIGLNQRPEGFSGNSLVFAFTLSLASSLVLINTAKSEVVGISLWQYLPSLLAFSMVVMSLSRAPILLTIALYVLAIALVSGLSINRLYIIKASALVVGMLSISFIVLSSTDFGYRLLEKRIMQPTLSIASGTVNDHSFNVRLDLNLSGVTAFLNSPIFGYGLQNTVHAANSASNEALNRQTSYQFSHLHNDYITYAVAGGSATLLLFIALMFLPWIICRKYYRDDRKETLQSFGAIITFGFTLMALTNVVLGHDILSTFYSISIILLLLPIFGKSFGKLLD